MYDSPILCISNLHSSRIRCTKHSCAFASALQNNNWKYRLFSLLFTSFPFFNVALCWTLNISYWCRSVMGFFLLLFLFVCLFIRLFCVMLVCYCSFTIRENMCNHLQPLTSVWHTHIHRLCFAYEMFQFFHLRKQFDVAIVKIYWFFFSFSFQR